MNRIGLALLAASVAGCSVEPTAPPAVTLDHDPVVAFDRVTLRWMPPTGGDVSGYALEARGPSGSFETIGTVGVERTSFTYAIAAQTPELTDFEFRVRALPDDAGSRASAAIPFHRGLRPPAIACAECPPDALCGDCTSVDGAFTLAVTNRSAVADGLLLERGIRFSPAEDAAWTAIPLPAASATFVDLDGASAWIDGAKFEYRLSAVKGAERSAAVSRGAVAAPPLAPRIVSVTAAGGAVDVTAENTSRSANGLSLLRDAWTGCCTTLVTMAGPPPRGATAVLRDPVPSATRVYYEVRALSPWYGASSSAWTIWPAPPTDPAFSAVVLPRGTRAVRTGAGPSFATAALARGDPFTLYAASGMSFPVGDGWLASPGLALDPLGHPHAVYALGTYAPSSLVHAWHDGAAWQSEDLGSIAGSSPIAFDVGIDGTVLACWRVSSTELRVASRGTGGWSFDSVSVAVGSGEPLIAGDAAGGVHVLIPSSSAPAHLFRGGGAWAAEAVPAFSGAVALLADARGLAVVGTSGGSAWILERSGAGWGAVEPLGAMGPYDGMRAARSPAGERIVVGASSGKLWIRDGTGTVERTWTSPGGSFDVGFSGDGRAWVLSGISDAFGESRYTATLYEEP